MCPASLKSIADLCRLYPAARKVFIVPRGVKTNLARAVAQSGFDWANASFATPRDYAWSVAECSLVGAGQQPLHRDSLELWLMAELPAIVGGPGSYFARARFGPSMIRAFAATLDSLRLAGVSADNIRRSELRSDKKEPLVAVLRAYEAHLDRAGLYDDRALFDRASQLVSERNDVALLCVLGETALSRSSTTFLNLIPAANRIVLDASQRPRSSSAASWLLSEEESNRFERIVVDAVNPKESYAIETLAPEHEVDAVLSDIVRRGLRLDQVEIAYSTRKYLPLLSTGVSRFRHRLAAEPRSSEPSLPASFADGTPIGHSFVGQALVSYLRWLAGGQDARLLAQMANGRFLTFRSLDLGNDVYPDQLGAFLIRRQVGAGRAAAEEALDTWAAAVEHDMYGSDRAVQQNESLRTVLARFFDLVPSNPIVSIAEVVESAQSFLDSFVDLTRPEDKRTASLLREQLETLRLPEPRNSLDSLATFLADLFGRRSLPGSNAVEGALHVVPLEKCGYAGRKHVYVIGLDEQTFPGGSADSPVLLDDERQLLSRDLRVGADRSRSRVDAFHRVVDSTAGSATLVYSSLDPIFGRAMDRSTTLDALIASRNIPVRQEKLGESVRLLSESGMVLGQSRRRGFDEYAESHYPWLAAGFRAEVERATDAFSSYSGFLGIRTPELDIRGAEHIVSPSALERMVKCPYIYFVRDVLKVRPPDAVERRPGRWLSSLEFGNLLHGLFFEFMTTIKSRGERPSQERHAVLLDELLSRKIAEYQRIVPTAGEVAFERERVLLSQAAAVFLGSESLRDADPIAFEAGFGSSVEDAKPVRLADDVAFKLRGSIDRVDLMADGYEIWDYKSGSPEPFSPDLRSDPEHLQWALYAYVWSDVLAPDALAVSRSGYFFTSGSAYGARISAAPPERVSLANRLRPLFEMMAEGAFPHIQLSNPGDSPCRYCDYKSICGTERREAKDYATQELFEVETPAATKAVRAWGAN